MTASLFDVLREMNGRGEMLRDRPEATWCKADETQMDLWEQMGGVPADLSTVECLAWMALTLWRQHKALKAVLDDLMENPS